MRPNQVSMSQAMPKAMVTATAAAAITIGRAPPLTEWPSVSRAPKQRRAHGAAASGGRI